jgi:Na+-translocating ferredoxin:NAD+ oxidoreductase RnfG subunit
MGLVLLAVAWVIGAARAKSDLMPAVKQAMPEAEYFERQNGTYAAWADSDKSELLGYVAIGMANGYGGPLTMAVGVSGPNGDIAGVAIAGHKETSAWITRVEKSGILESLIGKSHRDHFELGNDVDGVTGATYTSRAIAEAARSASQDAAGLLGLPVTTPPPPKVVFGIPEIVLILLFAVGYLAHKRGFKYQRHARWATMITGMVVLGFVYNQPLTLSNVNKFLLGYWPAWQTHLYWYLLMGGMLFVFTVDNKNPYCQWFCPFGATQECFGLIGGAKIQTAGRYHGFLKWVQRGLAWAAILVALLLLNPGSTSYEVFGALFDLVGSNLQYLLLGIVLLASMFIRRPWCTYLCPLAPVMDLYRTFRMWIKESWKSLGNKTAA